jgi:diaminopimelate decarboxylase
MDHFNYHGNLLHAEEVPLHTIVSKVGTPCYVYSRATIERHWHAFDDSFGDHPHLVCYAVKANSNLAVLELLARLGSGFDIVSGGELERVLRAGGEAGKIVFSGVAKNPDEIRRALEVGVKSINIESDAELEVVNRVALETGNRAPVSIRVNPDIDADTHPYIATGLEENKFGVAFESALDTYRRASALDGISVQGIACHIGSQITSVEPFTHALERVLLLVEELDAEGIAISHLDLGGGLGVRYNDETPPEPAEYTEALLNCLHAHGVNLPVCIEPGRAIAGNSGILLTTIQYLKSNRDKNFAIVDAGMNDLLRPSLYQAQHEIIPINKTDDPDVKDYDVVGPICETGDVLGLKRSLAIKQGDILAVRTAGAYGSVMASNYNSRPRPPEVMVDGSTMYIVRRRESLDDLMAGESTIPSD